MDDEDNLDPEQLAELGMTDVDGLKGFLMATRMAFASAIKTMTTEGRQALLTSLGVQSAVLKSQFGDLPSLELVIAHRETERIIGWILDGTSPSEFWAPTRGVDQEEP